MIAPSGRSLYILKILMQFTLSEILVYQSSKKFKIILWLKPNYQKFIKVKNITKIMIVP